MTGDVADVADPNQRYRTESRPDSKTRWAWYTAFQQGVFTADVLRVSYRLYGDDWGMLSHTVDSFYRWQFTEGMFLEPHLRGYTQSAADFYRTFLVTGDAPTNVSADYRLAEMWTSTIGLTWGMDLSSQAEVRFGAEWYHQEPTASDVIGTQSRADLVEPVDAYMARAGTTWQW